MKIGRKRKREQTRGNKAGNKRGNDRERGRRDLGWEEETARKIDTYKKNISLS